MFLNHMLVDELKSYVKRLGVAVEVEPRSVKGLPLFVEASNDWYDAEIGGFKLVLAVAKRTGLAPQDVIAQWTAIRCNVKFDCVMVLRGEDNDFCGLLDAAHVDYVMPGLRMHVEGKLMLVTRPAAKGAYVPKGRMSIVAQQIVLHHLLKGKDGRSRFEELVTALGLGQVRVSVAARELERLNFCSVDRVWRAHALVWSLGKRDLWERALPMMDSPVQRRMRVRNPPAGLPVAGIEALSSMSMLASDAEPTYAICKKDGRVKAIKDGRYEGATVEVWKYDPVLLSRDGTCVDPLSLYLSLKGDPDQRVQGELKTVMEELKW